MPKISARSPIEMVVSSLENLSQLSDDSYSLESIYAELDKEERKALVIYALKDLIQKTKRKAQLKVEREAWEKSIVKDREESERKFQEQQKRIESYRKIEEKKEVNELQKVFNSPSEMYHREDRRKVIWNSKSRKAFRYWCEKEGKDFEDWLNRARKVCPEEDKDCLEADWYHKGPEAYMREKHHDNLMKMVSDVVEVVKEHTRLAVTKELLQTEFALGNGVKVTWGTATKENHEQRIALLSENVAGNLEAAARHRLAIQMIEENSVETLSEVPCAD